MATRENHSSRTRKKRKRAVRRAKRQAEISVVSLRISDDEKGRIDEIMRIGNLRHYSDVMKMAFQMIQVPNNDEYENDEKSI